MQSRDGGGDPAKIIHQIGCAERRRSSPGAQPRRFQMAARLFEPTGVQVRRPLTSVAAYVTVTGRDSPASSRGIKPADVGMMTGIETRRALGFRKQTLWVSCYSQGLPLQPICIQYIYIYMYIVRNKKSGSEIQTKMKVRLLFSLRHSENIAEILACLF